MMRRLLPLLAVLLGAVVLGLVLPALAGQVPGADDGAQPAPPAQPTRRIALTFDDAPRDPGVALTTQERSEKLLQALASRQVTAAFFVTTQGLARNPDGHARIMAYARAGHRIANHTHTHPWAHRVPVQDYLAEIDRAEALLDGFPNRRPWFRFPYLDEGRTPERTAALAAGLKERGLINGYVTVDNYDWYLDRRYQQAVSQGRSVDHQALGQLYVDLLLDAARFYDDAAVGALGRSPAHVLLLHENDLAALYVDDLIDALRDQGWQIISPDQAYADPIASMIPTTRFTMQGRVAALAAQRGRSPRTFDLWSSDEARIDLFIDYREVFGPAPSTEAP